MLPAGFATARQRLRAKQNLKSAVVAGRVAEATLRRATEEELAQRLYSILLAVHAAENDLGENPLAWQRFWT